jgi:hypothetical protein
LTLVWRGIANVAGSALDALGKAGIESIFSMIGNFVTAVLQTALPSAIEILVTLPSTPHRIAGLCLPRESSSHLFNNKTSTACRRARRRGNFVETRSGDSPTPSIVRVDGDRL